MRMRANSKQCLIEQLQADSSVCACVFKLDVMHSSAEQSFPFWVLVVLAVHLI